MNNKELLQNDLAVQKEKIISKSEYWISFIQTMSRHYKHDSDIQIFIHSQFPDSAACADADLWKRKFNRTVLIGKKCVHFFTDDNKPVYLYDISRTAPIPGKPKKMPWIWSLFDNTLKISYTETVKNNLIKKHSLSSDTLPDCLSELCFRKTAEYLKDDQSDFFKLIYESVSYCVKYRCCPNEAKPRIENFSFLNQCSADKLISTVSHTVNEVFADIESLALSEKRRIIENKRSNNYELGNKNNQRNTSREMPRNKRIYAGYAGRKRKNMDTAREPVSILPSDVQRIETGGDNSADEGRNNRGGSSGGINAQIRSDIRRTGSSSTGGTGELLSSRKKPLGREGGRDSSREIRHPLQELSSEQPTGTIRGNDEQRNSKQTSSERQQPNSGFDRNNNRAAARKKYGVSDGSGNRRFPDNDTADEQLYKLSRGNSAESIHAVNQNFEQLTLFGNTNSEPIPIMSVNQNIADDFNEVYSNKITPTVNDLSVGDIILYNGKRREIEQINEKQITLKDLDAPDFGGILLGTGEVYAYNGRQEDMNAKGFEILSKTEHNKDTESELSVEKPETPPSKELPKDTLENDTNNSDVLAVDLPEKEAVSSSKEPKSGMAVTYHIESDNIEQGGSKSRFKANSDILPPLKEVGASRSIVLMY